MTATPVSASAAAANGVRSIDVTRPVDAGEPLPLLDRRGVVLPRPAHSRYVRRMAATMMDGKALAERIRAEVAGGRARNRARRPGNGARRRRPGVPDLHPAQAGGGCEGRDRRDGHPAAGYVLGGGAAGEGRRAEHRRAPWTRCSSSCRCRTRSTRLSVIRGDRTREGRRRHPSAQRRRAPARAAAARAGDGGRRDGACSTEYAVELDGARAVVVGRSDDRRQAGRAAARAGERDRHGLPLAHAGPRRAHARRRRARRRGRRARRRDGRTW